MRDVCLTAMHLLCEVLEADLQVACDGIYVEQDIDDRESSGEGRDEVEASHGQVPSESDDWTADEARIREAKSSAEVENGQPPPARQQQSSEVTVHIDSCACACCHESSVPVLHIHHLPHRLSITNTLCGRLACLNFTLLNLCCVSNPGLVVCSVW